MQPILIDQAKATDVPAIAALFLECFRESVLHHCGKLPKPLAMQDVFTLVYTAEPQAALVARQAEGTVVGYCFAPVHLHSLWWKAVWEGHLLKWTWRWLTGQYGFGLHPVKVIVLNKAAFLRSAMLPVKAADAQILSIAVGEAYRGQGIAGALMQAALTYFRICGVRVVRLEVRPDNKPAVRIYEKLGFFRGGITRDSQGEWLIMFREMENEQSV